MTRRYDEGYLLAGTKDSDTDGVWSQQKYGGTEI